MSLRCLYPLLLLVSIYSAYGNGSANWEQLGESINGVSSFGHSVAISSDGQKIAIGAPQGGLNNLISGLFKIYRLDTPNSLDWILEGSFSGEASGDGLGSSIAMNSDGTKIAVGAPYSDTNGVNSGSVKIYNLHNGNWTLSATVFGDGASPFFGYSVTMNAEGTKIAVGTPYGNINGENSGLVKVYELINGFSWEQIGSTLKGNTSDKYFGTSVAMNSAGSMVAIGSPEDSNEDGYVSIYHISNNDWLLLDTVYSTEASYYFGRSLAIDSSGSTLAVGVPYSKTGPSSLQAKDQIFQLSNGSYNKFGNTIIDHDGKSAGSIGSTNISLSPDGLTVAIGSERSGSRLNGHVRVYEKVNSNWEQVGTDIDGSDYDWLGNSVSISADGTRVVIGASYSGYVKVMTTNLPRQLPLLQLDDFYENQYGFSSNISAQPVSGYPDTYTFQWYLNGNLIPAVFGGTNSSFTIAADPSSEGTWRIEVTNDAGTTSAEFEYRVFVDSDSDGYSDYRESNILGTNPNNADTDGDGLSDYNELETHGTQPTLADSNGDGFSDGMIFNSGLSLSTDYSLLSQDFMEQQEKLRAESATVVISNNAASLPLVIEESTDLENWTVHETINLSIPLKEDETTKYFRYGF